MKLKRSVYGIAFLSLVLALPAYAQDYTVSALNAQDMINRIATQIPQLMRLVTAFSYVMGMYLIFMGIMKLKQYGESRTMMSQSHELKGPVIFIAVGAMLLYFPTSVQVGLSTFFAEPSPYGYLEGTDEWSGFINNAFMVIQLFGVIAFVRGLLLLSRLGGHGGQQDTFGRAMTHIIGGIFCINIYQFIKVILFTLGIDIS